MEAERIRRLMGRARGILDGTADHSTTIVAKLMDKPSAHGDAYWLVAEYTRRYDELHDLMETYKTSRAALRQRVETTEDLVDRLLCDYAVCLFGA